MWFTLFVVILVAVILYLVYIKRSYGRVPKQWMKRDLTGKVVVITGGSSGLGLGTARCLAKQNATVIFACRNKEKTMKAIGEITNDIPDSKDRLHFIHLELSDLDSVKSFVNEFEETGLGLDILINNAGIPTPMKRKSAQGFEMAFAVNHLGHFLLTALLLPKMMKQAEGGRLVTLSSILSLVSTRRDFSTSVYSPSEKDAVLRSYRRTKLACLLLARSVQRIFDDSSNKKCFACSVAPGVVDTNIFGHIDKFRSIYDFCAFLGFLLMYPFMRTVREGVEPILYAVLCPEDECVKNHVNGGYLEDCNRAKRINKLALKEWFQDKIWNWSMELIEENGRDYDIDEKIRNWFVKKES